MAVLAVGALLALGAASALGELVQRGNIFIRFDGNLSPKRLPRSTLAPIGVRIEGTIRVPAGERRPGVRRIEIALNRGGRLDTRGLPICRRRQLRLVNSAEALRRCGGALVGSGGITMRTDLPDQPPTTLRGELLLFNSVVRRRPAILAHVFVSDSTPIAGVLVFKIRRRGGAFGTTIAARFPAAFSRTASLKAIFMQLERRYTFRGRKRSYLSAACAAPPGFPGATFPFARATLTFDDGRSLSSTLIRSCRVAR